MAIEILKQPQLQINDGVTYHIYAIERTSEVLGEQFTGEGQEQVQQVTRAKAVGAVAIAPSRMARYLEDAENPYMIHNTMKVRGLVGGEAVYDKTVSPRGFLGSYKPFYGLRIAIAKRRAAHRVKSVLAA